MCTARTPTYTLLALSLLCGCSASDVMQVAVSRDPSAMVDAMARNRAESYKTNPLRLVNDLKQAQRNYDRVLSLLRGEVDRSWGGREVVLPDNRRYVKYTQNYMSRAIVEFDSGTVVVETLDQQSPQQSLKNAIVTTLLTPDDPRAVDLYSDKEVKLSGSPYLYSLLEDHDGKAIGTPWRAERYAEHLLLRQTKNRSVTTGKGEQPVLFVKLQMVNDFENRQALRYQTTVAQHAGRFGVSRSLVYAIIKTESAFNPFAVSPAPAYGLMQLVPDSGGRDAYNYAKGYDRTPSKEYLFDASNNIELGTAYLSLLDRQYLAAIADPISREYCSIAAYNGGAGSVLSLFAADRAEAARHINRMSPSAVLQRLREQHPRAETRRYLVKVLDARRLYATL